MEKLYLDLDGVMFDFDGYFFKEFGMISKDLSDSVLWGKINGHGSFFENIPPYEGSHDFLDTLKSIFHVTILTACPKSNYSASAIHKRKAVREHFGKDIQVIPMLGGVNKCLFMHEPGNILIDDFEKNIAAWNSLGGRGILHTSYENTLAHISELLNGH